jgi:protein polybromo-1
MGKRRRSDANESEGEAPTTPSAKRASTDKWSFPDELKTATHLCQKLYDFLRRAKDDENRLLCECLVRVPSRRSHPQYYDVIKTPIDLMRIQQKLKTDEYRSVHDFLHHVRLLLENARSFFGEGSEEVACVDQLETRFTQRLQEYAGHFTHSSGTDSSPPSLTLRISKDQLQGLSSSSSSSGKTSQSGLSRQQQPRSKLTRSKAWLQGYMSSGDPLKLFLAAVYEHTDSTGVCIAEVFHELPSAKDYPEYYEVITEPIDLHTIKRNLEEGRYSNLRDIQEDMILMIKNAHYFNEPGSDVYKFASTLRKFVISHCADLERRFHTVTPKPLKVSLKRPGVSGGGGETRDEGEGDEKKIPKLKVRIGSDSVGEVKVHSGSSGEAGVKVSRRLSQSSKTPDTEDESANSESSGGEDSSQSEDEGEGEVVRKKAKVSRGKEREDQLAKLLKSRNTPPLKKQALALYHHLVRHRDTHGRQTAELFMRKPSAKMYPEYYIVIRSPIDFREISHKIKTEQYTSLEEVMKDVELLVGNATTFNEEDSTVYQDALTLQQLARSASNRLQTVWPRPQPHPPSKSMTSLAQPLPPAVATPITVPSPRPRGRPRKHPLPPDVGVAVGGASIQSPISSLFMAIKMFTLQGRGLWRSLQNQPTVGSEARKEFSTISMKIATGKFLNVHQLYQELHQSLDHVVQTQPAESLLYRDALILCRVATKKYLELTADERGTPLCPNVQEAVQGMLRSVLTRTLQCPEAEGLREVVVTREIQADGDEPPTTHKLSLPLMEKWVERCCYRRLDSLQNDLLSILSFAAEQSPTLCQSAVAVGRAYIGARDAMVTGGKGGRLTSPALSYTAEHLEHDIAGKMGSSDKKGVEPVAEKTTAESEVGKAMEGAGSGETFDELAVAGKTYRVGDVVYLTSRNAGQKPHIVSIDKLWRDSTGAAWLQGCWFYRPEETFHLATRKFYEKEVFKSDFHSVAMLSEVQGPCCVLVLKDYVRSSPIDFPEDDVFVCESRYAHKAKSFKKIKNWSYPLGRQPRLITRDVPLSLRRVPSVFMTQSTRVKGSGSQSVVPVSDTVGSSDKDAELFSEAHGSDPSLPHPVQLENVKAWTVSNPTPGCTYYEQYCIDEDKFRLGMCV